MEIIEKNDHQIQVGGTSDPNHFSNFDKYDDKNYEDNLSLDLFLFLFLSFDYNLILISSSNFYFIIMLYNIILLVKKITLGF